MNNKDTASRSKEFGLDRVLKDMEVAEARQQKRLENCDVSLCAMDWYRRQGALVVCDALREFLKTYGQRSDFKALLALMRFLDNELSDAWMWKFSTEHMSTYGHKNPRAYDKYQDSVYYIMPEGASLRLRVISLQEGKKLSRVVQPIMEKILFSSKEINYYLEEPRVGMNVYEHSSPTLRDALEKEDFSLYKPDLWVYRRKNDGVLLNIEHKTQRKGKGTYTQDHFGDHVNEVFF